MKTTFSPAPEPSAGEPVLLGLSGGVDSAVAARRLLDRGCEVVAVTTRNFCFGDGPFDPALSPRSCCSADAIDAARELCVQLGIQHHILDVAEDFGSAVIDNYVQTYASGITPSPCVNCNTQVRFPGLAGFADSLGIHWVATGHYVRLVQDAAGRRYVRKGVDLHKDQSYFLYRLPQDLLARSFFPLGESDKPTIREEARRAALIVADAPESQELCFVPDGNRRPLLGEFCEPGDIIGPEGTVLGRHEGLPLYTPGQRKGLGIAAPAPLYVRRLDVAKNQLHVGPVETLDQDRISLDRMLYHDPLEGTAGLRAKTRYRHGGLAVAQVSIEGELGIVDFHEADRAPAPGQALVLYRDDVVVGGGTIVEAAPL